MLLQDKVVDFREKEGTSILRDRLLRVFIVDEAGGQVESEWKVQWVNRIREWKPLIWQKAKNCN